MSQSHLSLTSISHSKPRPRNIILWYNADFEAINNFIAQFAVTFFNAYNHNTPVNTLWDEFKTLCNSCIEMIPQRLFCANDQPPWITRDIKRLFRKKQCKYNNARRTNLDEDWSAYRNLKKEIQRLCRTSHNNYISTLLDKHNKCTKKLWRYIKNMRKEQTAINTLHYNGVTYTDSEGKANALNNQFVSVFTNEDQSPLPHISTEPTPDISQITINVEGVFNLLSKIEPNKVAGTDGIPPRLLKEAAYQMAPLLTFIFQSSLDQGQLPQDWKSANITPIYKKGNRTDPANYRPISLTSTCSKILEHIIYSSISTHLSNYNILCTNQHGFRTGLSCDTQLHSKK